MIWPILYVVAGFLTVVLALRDLVDADDDMQDLILVGLLGLPILLLWPLVALALIIGWALKALS